MQKNAKVEFAVLVEVSFPKVKESPSPTKTNCVTFPSALHLFLDVVCILSEVPFEIQIISSTKRFYSPGDVVLFSCNEDLVLSGSSAITCGRDGRFSPSPPSCLRKFENPSIEARAQGTNIHARC